MNYLSKIEKYKNKINVLVGAGNASSYIYRFNSNGLQRLLDLMFWLRDELPADPGDPPLSIRNFPLLDWGDATDGTDVKLQEMYDFIDMRFPRFKYIFRNLYHRVMSNSRNFFTIDIAYDTEDKRKNFIYTFLQTLFNLLKADVVTADELCIFRYGAHNHEDCVNRDGVKSPHLLHWPSRPCEHDNDQPNKKYKTLGGCGRYLNKKCTFLHRDQEQFEVECEGTKLLLRTGFNTVPACGKWYPDKPFVNNNGDGTPADKRLTRCTSVYVPLLPYPLSRGVVVALREALPREPVALEAIRPVLTPETRANYPPPESRIHVDPQHAAEITRIYGIEMVYDPEKDDYFFQVRMHLMHIWKD